MSRLSPALVSREQAADFIRLRHRHHEPDQGDRFVLGCWDETADNLCGVAVVGNPRAPALAKLPWLLEVTRVCTDGTRNACSFLYARASELAEAKGWTALVTYTLASEGGASLRALGWWPEALTKNDRHNWSNREGRREDHVHADVRWLWLSRFDFHAPPKTVEQSPQLALLGVA